MKEHEKKVPTEEKLVAEALRKTEELFKRISENPQGGGIMLESSSDSRAVLYRALLREKATRERVEAGRDALREKARVLMEALKDLHGICPTCQKLELISRIRNKGKGPRCQGGKMIHLWLCYLGLHFADDGLNSGLHTFCRCCGKQLCRHPEKP